MGAAGHLAAAAWAHQPQLMLDGLDKPRPLLAIAEVGSWSNQRMIAPLAKFIDWYALQAIAMLPSIRKCARSDSKLTEAIEFLNGPNFIPAESNHADLEFNFGVRIYRKPEVFIPERLRGLFIFSLQQMQYFRKCFPFMVTACSLLLRLVKESDFVGGKRAVPHHRLVNQATEG